MFLERTWRLILWRLGQVCFGWWIALVGILFFEGVWFIRIRKRSYFKKALYGGIFIAYLFLILIVTVLSRRVIGERYWGHLVSIAVSSAWTKGPGIYGAIDTASELILNILMFVPFGYLLARLSGGRKWIVFGGSFLITLSIETLQLVLRRGFFELADILLNMTGAVLGYAAYRIIRRLTAKWKNSAQAE